MADFDTSYWSGGSYTPTDYGAGAAYPDWSSTSMDYAPSNYNFSYSQPDYYSQYAGYAPSWGSMPGDDFSSGYMPGESMGIPDGGGMLGSMGGIWDKVSGWLDSPTEGGGTVGSGLLSKGITGGLGALMGLGQQRALEKARKREQERLAERERNAGKVAAQQRLDYLNGLRQDPNFREFTVNAPDRNVMANTGDGGSYGQQGGEHMFFDPSYLSRITTTPVNAPAFKCGGLVEEVRHMMNGGMARGGLNATAGGQDDVIDAKLAPGEYVFDAEAVSALGDGSTEAGAAKLDAMRKKIRKHKRSGGLNSIPPKAKNPEGYM